MSIEPEPAYQHYPAMAAAQAAPWSPDHQPGHQSGPPPGWRPGVNGFAIASFVFGLIGGIPLGVVFGVIALVRTGRTRQRGKGLAIAGLVLSGLWAVFLVVVFIAATLHGIKQASGPKTNAATSYNFQVGQCFDRAQTTAAAVSTPTDCATPHYAEVFGVETVPGATYPGKTAVENLAHSKCPADAAKALTPGLNYPDVTVAFLFPQDNSWALGDRTVKCFFHRRDGQPMTGLVKDTGTPYTADQKRYIAAVEPYNAIVNEQESATGWTAKRDIVARSIPVVQKEIAALQAGPWPTEVQPMIKSMVADEQIELTDRQRAAAATDEVAFEHAMDDADDHNGADQASAIRAALHLPPSR